MLKWPKTACMKQLKPVISEPSLLASVMVEQSIIQIVIYSIEKFNDTWSKFESWIVYVENAAQTL